MDRENVAVQNLLRLEIDVSMLLQEPGIHVRIIILLEIVDNQRKRTSSPDKARRSVCILHGVEILNPAVPISAFLAVKPPWQLAPRHVHPRKSALLKPRVVRRDVKQATSPGGCVAITIRPSRITHNKRAFRMVNEANRFAGDALVPLPFVVHENDGPPGRRPFRGIGPPSPNPSMGSKHEIVAAVVSVPTRSISGLEEQKRSLRIPAASSGHDSSKIGKVSQWLVDSLEIFHELVEFLFDGNFGVKRLSHAQKVKVVGSIRRPDCMPGWVALGIKKRKLTQRIDPIRDRAIRVCIFESNFLLNQLCHLGFINEFATAGCHNSEHELAIEVVSPLGADERFAVNQ
mmetsp:Transcript_5092/g.12288  ORF Transcript_5092/g.12288 Transcript_5092/m.12288 type:complete len:345 (-) Transcript_5092:1248-2282(-)